MRTAPDGFGWDETGKLGNPFTCMDCAPTLKTVCRTLPFIVRHIEECHKVNMPEIAVSFSRDDIAERLIQLSLGYSDAGIGDTASSFSFHGSFLN